MLDDTELCAVIGRIETLLPIGVRPRQLSVRTLLLGILLALADGRPAHLSRVHQALVALPQHDRRRLGVVVKWKGRAHELTYRQIERTAALVVKALSKDVPDGIPSSLLGELLDALVEASVPIEHKASSSSLAVDWTDVESFSVRRTKADGVYADPEASWGHRKGGGPGEKDELFFGYYLSLAVMVRNEAGPQGPELVRRMALSSCDCDPVPVMVGVLRAMSDTGIGLGDILVDSGYAHRVPEHFALPLRANGAALVMDLHPHDRGPQGTHGGAVIANGSLYCPATPAALLDLGPAARDASTQQLAEHDQKTAEADRHRLRRISADDTDGYHRVMCPALAGKLRCPLRPDSLALPYDRPTVVAPPEHPPTCCVQQTITVPPTVATKTAQKHPYPGEAWRRSYARRTAVERSNSRIKDPATVDVSRGWCRMMGLVPMSVFLACALVVRNLAVTDAFESRRADDARRPRAGLPPRTRRRRRRTIGDLVETANAPP